MAAPIATKLVLNTAAFTRGIGMAGKGLMGLGAVAGKVTGLIVKLTLAMTALAGVFSAIVIRQTGFIARLQDTSDKLGVNIQFLQKFRFAAEQSGVSVETADMALQRFTRRVAEAAQGTGEARGALARLGIQLKDNDGNLRDMEDILFDVADGIAETTDEAERVRLAFKFFDSEGVSLVNTLNNGGDALREMFNEAQALGGVLSADAARGVKEFDNRLTDLKTLVGGITNQFVAALAPALEDVTKKFIEFVKEIAGEQGGFENLGVFLKDVLLDVIVKLIRAVEGITNAFIKMFNVVRTAGKELGLFKTEADTIRETIEILEGLGDGTILNVGPVLANLREFEVYGVAVRDALREAFGEDPGYTITLAEREKALENLRAKLAEFKDEGSTALNPVNFDSLVDLILGYKGEAEERSGELTDAIEEVVVQGQSMGFTLEKLLDKIFGEERMTRFWEKWDSESATAMDKLKAVGELFFEVAEDFISSVAEKLQQAGVGDYIKTIEDGFVSAMVKLEDALADAVLKGKADFSDLADHLKQVLAKAMIQKFITGPILALFGFTPRAEGGPVSAGQPYLVGEKGPELFVPSQSGGIMPNDELVSGGGGAMGMGATTVNYNINAVDALSFKQMVARDPEFIFSVTQAGRRRLPI